MCLFQAATTEGRCIQHDQLITTVAEQRPCSDVIACIQIYLDCVQIHFRWPAECISNVSPVTNSDEISPPCSHVILSVGTLTAAKEKKNHQRRGLLWLFGISKGELKCFLNWWALAKSTVLKLCDTIWRCTTKAKHVVLQFGCWFTQHYLRIRLCMKTVYLPAEMIHFKGCRDSSQYYNRANESSQMQAIRQVSDKAQFNKSLAVSAWLEAKTERSNYHTDLLFAVDSHVKWHPGAQEKNKDHGNVCFIFGFMFKKKRLCFFWAHLRLYFVLSRCIFWSIKC